MTALAPNSGRLRRGGFPGAALRLAPGYALARLWRDQAETRCTIFGYAFTGDAEVNGQPIEEPGRDRMVLFQEHALFPWLDVLGNVLFPLKLKPGLTDKERLEVAHYLGNVVERCCGAQ